MNKTVKQLIRSLRRPAYALAMVGLLFAAIPGQVLAAIDGGQVQRREIRMSDNGVSGGTITSGVGSGTNVTYRVKFRAATTYVAHGIVVDFCSGAGTPFIGDSSCPLPTAFSIPSTPTIDTSDYTVNSVVDTQGLGSGWTPSSDGQTFKMSNTAGVSLTAGQDYTFAITGITNTSTTGTFYARLITYSAIAGSYTSYDHATAGTYQDYGGFALSTANIVQVTAKVQETLTFCVSGTTAPAPATPNDPIVLTAPTSCLTATAPAVTLGHGTNNTLTADQVDTNGVFTLASTNALNGLTIRMRNSNTCGGLSINGGTTCDIPAAGAGTGASASDIPVGIAAFGMMCNDSTGGSGSMACETNYKNVAHNTFPSDAYYGMDTTTVDDNVTTLFGDVIAKSAGPINNVTNQLNFAATASNITPAGIYRANLAMIATGSF